MAEVRIPIRRLAYAPAQLPEYATTGAVGMDLRMAGETRTLEPFERALLPTGFCIAIPDGFEGQIRMRSGLARDTGLILPNAPGTIDPDYRGEVQVLVLNASNSPITICRSDRIAQLVILPIAKAVWQECDDLPPSGRGSGGFGSTGAS